MFDLDGGKQETTGRGACGNDSLNAGSLQKKKKTYPVRRTHLYIAPDTIVIFGFRYETVRFLSGKFNQNTIRHDIPVVDRFRFSNC